VVGGFWVNDGDMCCLQASTDGCTSYRAEQIYSDDELQRALVRAAEVGPAPWFQRNWEESGLYGLTPGSGSMRAKSNCGVLGIRVLQHSALLG
jgi:hypothetical protein